MSVSVSAFSPVLGSGFPLTSLAPSRKWRCAFIRLHGGGWALVAGVPSDRVGGVIAKLDRLGCSSIVVLPGKTLSSVRFRGPASAVASLAEFFPVACAVR